MNEALTIRTATKDDAAAISSVLAANREDRGLFQESAEAVVRTIEDFLVACDRAGQVVGCAGLHQDSPSLAEIYAVAVTPQCQGQGAGRQLMQACKQRTESAGVQHLWLATVKPAYFQRYGFQVISRWELPAATLQRKLRQTFQQPVTRWLPALFGKHTFMRCKVNRAAGNPNLAG
jgi:N-acetylglutamate synthase-like GNAT family acetyltransferase